MSIRILSSSIITKLLYLSNSSAHNSFMSITISTFLVNDCYVTVFLDASIDYSFMCIIVGTFLVNDHYATVLFDSGADYSFVSTAFDSILEDSS